MAIETIYLLGPEGTFSDYAARRLNDYLVPTGQSKPATLIYTRSILDALERASGDDASRAVAPIENSETGTVVATQDHLARLGLFIESEISVKIRLKIVADAPLASVTRVYVHPVAQGQCDQFVARELPLADVASTRSNIDSAIQWSASAKEDRTAGIVPQDYVPARTPSVEEHDIQNDAQNTTRFVVVRKGSNVVPDFRRKKTSLLIEPDADRPGLLFELLSVFKRHDINLCRIESRPARTHPWAYVFYLDITNNGESEQAIRELLAGRWHTVLLGTFDTLP